MHDDDKDSMMNEMDGRSGAGPARGGRSTPCLPQEGLQILHRDTSPDYKN